MKNIATPKIVFQFHKRGGDMISSPTCISMIISIHANEKGQHFASKFFAFCFNPRPRGGATMISSPIRILDDVSIHAPARGATL